MNKEKVFIIGAITNVPNYMEKFAKAQKELEAQGYSVINPALVNYNMPKDTTYEEYMKMAFTMLNMAGSVYMLKNWQQSCRCNREYGYALAKDMTIMIER